MDIAQEYMALPEHVRGGSLCMYGAYVGRPLDVCYDPEHATYEDGCLTIQFDGGRRIAIQDPEGIRVEGRVYTIDRARVVRYECHWPPEDPKEIRYRQYEVVDGELTIDTNDGGTDASRRRSALTIC